MAIAHRGERHTYDDVLGQVWRAQNALRALDARPGDRVALVVNDEPAFVAWFLAALRSGVVPVPLSTMLTADDLGTETGPEAPTGDGKDATATLSVLKTKSGHELTFDDDPRAH